MSVRSSIGIGYKSDAGKERGGEWKLRGLVLETKSILLQLHEISSSAGLNGAKLWQNWTPVEIALYRQAITMLQ